MKRNYSFILFIIVSLFFSLSTYSQDEECGFDILHNSLLQKDPSAAKREQQFDKAIANILKNGKGTRSVNTVYTIPVVVHVFHVGEAVGTGSNISDAQIIDAIQGLNNKWRNTINYAGTVDMEIEFCLASRDPNGNPTTGTVRVNASGLANYTANGLSIGSGCPTGANSNTLMDMSRWPVSDYLNIWVVNKICGASAYSTAPYGYPANYPYDGVAIDYNFMASNLVTLPHEVGHYFGLSHTFNGSFGSECPANNDCTVDGDKVCDTPPHARNNCELPNACYTGDSNISYSNYMSYCFTRNLFTQGQKDRVRAYAIIAPRLSLLSSLGCASLGTPDIKIKKISLFPNPAHQSFTIQSNDEIVNGKFSIYNMIGDLLIEGALKTTHNEIDISKLSKGIYLVLINNEGDYSCQKLIVE